MKVEQQALKAAFGKKYQKQTWSEAKKRSKGVQKSEILTSRKQKNSQKENEKYDKRKVQCYFYKKFSHFVDDCWSNKERNLEEANIIRRDSDDESVLLMASESGDAYLEDQWYMDTSCSNHLTGNKKWLVDFDSSKRI